MTVHHFYSETIHFYFLCIDRHYSLDWNSLNYIHLSCLFTLYLYYFHSSFFQTASKTSSSLSNYGSVSKLQLTIEM